MTKPEKIAKDLEPLTVDVTALKFDPKNARRHSERNIRAIQKSLERFGQLRPIVVQREGMIVRAGNGTLEAARRLGWGHIAALVVEQDDEEAIAFAIADNRTAELAEWDLEELATLLTDLDDTTLTEATGFDPAEIEALISVPWDERDQGKDLEDFQRGEGEGHGSGVSEESEGATLKLDGETLQKIHACSAWLSEHRGIEADAAETVGILADMLLSDDSDD